MALDTRHHIAKLVVVGVGGGGCNAVDRMIDAGVRGVEFYAINTDAQQLIAHSSADVTLVIGSELTGGLGAGSDPRLVRRPPNRAAPRSRSCCAGHTWCS